MVSKLALLFLLTGTLLSSGVGHKIPCWLTWTDSPSPEATGYYFYWRATNGVYSDTQRIGISPEQKPFDLRVIGLPKGQYYCSMTATNADSESELSVEILWDYTNPNKPSNLQITP